MPKIRRRHFYHIQLLKGDLLRNAYRENLIPKQIKQYQTPRTTAAKETHTKTMILP